VSRKIGLQELVALAERRFTPTAYGEWPRPIKDLASTHERSTISRGIKQVFLKGYVKVVAVKGTIQPERDHELEKEIINKFGLSGAVVVRPSSDGVDVSNADEWNDAIHSQLGHAMASFILESSILRDGDRIACASGRSPYHTVNWLAQGPKSTLKEIELISMSGATRPTHYSVMQNLVLDADFITQNLACWFEKPVLARYVGRHCVPHSKTKRAIKELRNINDALSEQTWARPVDIAIFGVGIMGKGHKLFTVAEQGIRDFQPILASLKALRKYALKYGTKHYCPVADISSRLIFVRPDGYRAIPSDVQAHIQHYIDEVNARTLTLSDRQLHNIRRGILVAGTIQKFAVVRQLIGEPFVRYVSVDDEIARKLVS
jgi:DNA-binding transcriptional regulator LsrR (DeoR family)